MLVLDSGIGIGNLEGKAANIMHIRTENTDVFFSGIVTAIAASLGGL